MMDEADEGAKTNIDTYPVFRAALRKTTLEGRQSIPRSILDALCGDENQHAAEMR